ncbi:hypothetical protein FJZ19_04460 [Candidatus Pacearchaeota archaeon]|nr:hypothetical protein [Candidatus Pacearchaeota archaeon]
MLQPEKDQHILINKEIIKKEIEEADIKKEDKIIEIGAGTGNLTKELAKKSCVLAFEIDEKFSKFLDKLKKKYENLEIIYGNALEYDWHKYNKIVANIPYSASEAILQKAINSGIKEIIMIVSSSFKEKLLSQEKIGLIAGIFYNIKPICKIGKENFFPVPRTESWLVKLERKDDNKNKIIKNILLKKGKIKNAILYSLVENGKTKNQAKEIIKKMNLDSQVLEKPTGKITSKFLIRLKNEFFNNI